MREQWIYDSIKQNKLIHHNETDSFNRDYWINKPFQSKTFQSQRKQKQPPINEHFSSLPSKPISFKLRNVAQNRVIPQKTVYGICHPQNPSFSIIFKFCKNKNTN